MSIKVTRRALTLGSLTALAVPYIARAAADPIRIGWMQALTGPSSAAGIGFHNGSTYAVSKLNAAGGINGRMVELVVRDTQGDPTKAVNAAQELIVRAKVHAIIGPGNSGETLATTPIISRAGIPQLHAGSLDTLIDPKQFPNAFRSGVSNAQWNGSTTNYVVNILKLGKVAVFGDSSGYGTSAAQSSIDELTKKGVSVVAQSLIDPNQVDVTAEMQRAQQSGAQALLVWSASTGFIARLLNTRAQLGWNVPVIGHPTLGSGETGKLLNDPKNWENVFPGGFRNCSFGSDGKLPSRQAEFVAGLPATIDLNSSLMWLVAWGYDAVNLLTSTIAKAGSDKPAAIIAALNDTRSFDGIMGKISFAPDDHDGFPDSDVVMVQANSFSHGSFKLAPGY